MNNKFVIAATSVFWIMLILLLRQCSPDNGEVKREVVYKTTSDTTYIIKDSIVYRSSGTVTVTKIDTVERPGDIIFIADSNYATLKKQYEELAQLYKMRNIYVDSIPIDSLGQIKIIDTLQYNKIDSRKYFLNYSLPVITNKEVSEPKHLFYMGGGLSLAESKLRQVQVSLLYKPKKKNVFGIHLGSSIDGTIYYGGSAYWLLNKNY
jgi:hypothetical protein